MITKVLQAPSQRTIREQRPKNAELTVYRLGADQDAIVPALRLLGQFDRRELRRFQHSLPCTMTLPVAYYDKVNPFVEALRSAGVAFKITSWSWVCPDEVRDDKHWCKGECKVMQVEEVTR